MKQAIQSYTGSNFIHNLETVVTLIRVWLLLVVAYSIQAI